MGNTQPKVLMLGAGFIGNVVIRKLKKLGYEVEIFDIMFGQDMLDVGALEEAIKRNDYVVQMAAIADLNVFEAVPLMGMKTNVWATVLVANYCSKHGKRLFNISTCCVYGNTSELPSSEESKTNPSEIYAEAKLAAEHIIKAYHKSFGLPYTIPRIATTYGPEMRDSLAVAVFIRQIINEEPVTVHGTGIQTRTLTYIDDVADGIIASITQEEKSRNQTFNISSNEELSVTDWVRIIAEVLNKEPIGIEYISDRKGQTFREAINAGKARRWLGWEATYSFKDGIENTFAWMKEIWKEEAR